MSEIADRIQEIGCECCGLTDHGVVSGHPEFSRVLTERGIKPIFGCELYHGVKTTFEKNERDQAHLIALAMTDEGLRNLWRLVDFGSQNFRYVGRVSHEAIKKYREGLVLTSACISGLVPQGALEGDDEHLNRYLDVMGDDFYIELHTYPGEKIREANLAQVEIAEERGLQYVYADDAHYASPDQYSTHDMYMARQTGDSLYTPSEERKMKHPKDSLYIRDEAGIRKALHYLPNHVVDNALENTALIAERANASLPGVRRHLPVYIPRECAWRKEPKSKSSDELLIDLVEEGLVRRYGKITEEIFERADRELEVFIDAGLSDYFLMAWDVIQFCESKGIIRGPGRGSSAGCLVAYALGITDVDPLYYDLIFERFYNAGREEGLPDIDSDFPREHRKTIRNYLERKWGEDKVRTIGTIKRMKPIETLNVTYNVAGIEFADKEAIKAIVQEVPDIDILGTDSIGWSEDSDPGKTIYVWDHVGPKIIEYIEKIEDADKQERLAKWINLVEAVCSRVEGYGVHPSGIVVSDVDLPENLPCFWSAGRSVQATNFPMSEVELLQYLKLDVLGLRTLDTLAKWEQLSGELPDWSGMEIEYEDHECWDLLERGLGLGVFQVEDGYAKRLAKDMTPRSAKELAIIVALNRPGPIRSGAPDSFITRMDGGEDEAFDGRKISMLQPILEESYGWFLYQEQVIKFFETIGYDLLEADAVRSILGKKKPEAMRQLRDGTGPWEGRGYFEMMERADFELGMAEWLWFILEDFAKYSFNKSHALAYAVLGFRCLYAKWRDPQAFFMACIATNFEDAGKYIAEARRMGIKVLPPDIDKSMYSAIKDEGNIRLGFGDIKGVRAAGRYVVELRDELGYDEIATPEALWEILEVEGEKWKKEKDAAALKGRGFAKRSPRQRLGEHRLSFMFAAGCWDERGEREIDLADKQELEQELLGVILTDNTEEAFAKYSTEVEECDDWDALRDEDTETVRLPGVITQVRETKTRAEGKKMGIVVAEWEGEDVEFVVFPRQWKSHKFLWKERTPVILKLRKTDRGINFEEGIPLT